ncbi:MAG: hypothetical protein IJT08_01440 [Alphaproteobacteria bacterium]|nr:hypothetical protein [Alphaproteobacteria bacterium]
MLPSVPTHLSIYKGKSSGKLRGEFQELRKRDWGQHMCARGYFVATHEQIKFKGCTKIYRRARGTS